MCDAAKRPTTTLAGFKSRCTNPAKFHTLCESKGVYKRAELAAKRRRPHRHTHTHTPLQHSHHPFAFCRERGSESRSRSGARARRARGGARQSGNTLATTARAPPGVGWGGYLCVSVCIFMKCGWRWMRNDFLSPQRPFTFEVSCARPILGTFVDAVFSGIAKDTPHFVRRWDPNTVKIQKDVSTEVGNMP